VTSSQSKRSTEFIIDDGISWRVLAGAYLNRCNCSRMHIEATACTLLLTVTSTQMKSGLDSEDGTRWRVPIGAYPARWHPHRLHIEPTA